MNQKYIIHRGNYSYKYPENSIPAFRECLENNLSIELDLHILKDNNVVVFHDDTLNRMCNKDVKIKDLTLPELEKFKLSNTIYRIPTLKEVLDLVGGYVLLDIELKSDVTDGRLEREVIKILKKYKGKYLLKSFNPRIVKNLKKYKRRNKMDFEVGLLLNNSKISFLSLIYSNPNFISFNYKNYHKSIFKFMSKLKPTLLYTFKNSEDINKAEGYNGGYIIENYNNIFKNN